MTKLDLEKELRQLYQPSSREVTVVDVPSFTFLMIDGEGDPNTSAGYVQAVEALFSDSWDKSRWKWTMMIMQPGFVPADAIANHVGSFSEEGPTIARVHRLISERSGLRGKHHEIYPSDIRRADPQKWKTILRQAML